MTDTIDAEIDEILKQAKGIIVSPDDGTWSYMTTAEQDKAKLQALLLRERKAELEELEYVDWESYCDKPKEKYDTGINELIDPLIENYVKIRKAELSRVSGEES